jgi:AraC-like DNA-binding protein
MVLKRRMPYKVAEVKHSDLASSYEISTKAHDEVRPAEHPGLEILFALKTPLEMTLRGQRKVIQPTDFLIYNAREAHSEIHSSSTTGMKSIVIEEEFLNYLLNEHGLNFTNLVFENTKFVPTSEMFRCLHLIEALRKSSTHLPLVEELLFSQLVLEILSAIPNSDSAKIEKFIETGHFPGSLGKAKKLIFSNATDGNLNLTELAKELGLSKFHFLRVFKKLNGQTPAKYMNRLKLELAQLHLQIGDKSVTQIAFDLGFENLSTFYALFQRELAIEPRKYAALAATGAALATSEPSNSPRAITKTYSHLGVVEEE